MNLLLLLAVLSAEAPPVKGTLCFSERECVATSGTRIEVEPAESPRTFVWRSEDDRTVFVGELERRAGSIDVDPKSESGDSRSTVTLGVRGQASRGWPAGVQFALSQSKEKSWKWTLPAASTRGETKIHLPAGTYRLSITAPRHRSEWRQVRAERNVDLGATELKALPSISGRVTIVEDEQIVPLAGAQIILGDGKVATVTNEQGIFHAELSEPLPKEVHVVSAGSGSRIVLLERLEPENDVGEIRLERGATLTLRVERPDDLRARKLGIRLLRKHETRYEPSEVAKADLAAGDDTTSFSDLAAGDYYVIVQGDEKLERLLVPLSVGAEDVTTTIEIQPFELRGRVLIGSEPLRQGDVQISPRGHGATWRAEVPIDSEGRFGGILWQHGRLSGFVQRGGGTAGMLRGDSPELGSDPSEWTMAFKNRSIRGRISDRDTGAAVGGFEFRLQTETANGRGYSSVRVADNGEYDITAWQDGVYDLIVTAPSYVPITKRVELSDADGSKQVDVPLDRGSSVTLEFVWPSGQRIANAAVFEGIARDGHNPERIHSIDATGRLTLRLGSDETRLLYVVPAEGSFAAVRVTPKKSGEDRPMRVVVPRPAGTLRLKLKDGDGNDAAGFVVMRHNGEFFPYPVTGRLQKSQSLGSFDLFAMPAGAYELWAMRPGLSVRAIPPTPPAHAPVRVGLGAGETSAELTVVVLN